MILTGIGLALVILASYILDDSFPQEHLETHVYSFIMFGCTLAYSIQRTWEEKLLSEIEVSSRRFVGLQGVFGMVMLLIFQAVFVIVNSKLSGQGSEAADVVWQLSVGRSLMIVSKHTYLWAMSLVLVVCMTVNEYSGIIVTKRVSCTFRTIIENSKVILVWIFEVIFVDMLGEKFGSSHYLIIFFIKLLGYLFIILGSLVVNEYVKISFCRMDKYHGSIFFGFILFQN